MPRKKPIKKRTAKVVPDVNWKLVVGAEFISMTDKDDAYASFRTLKEGRKPASLFKETLVGTQIVNSRLMVKFPQHEPAAPGVAV